MTTAVVRIVAGLDHLQHSRGVRASVHLLVIGIAQIHVGRLEAVHRVVQAGHRGVRVVGQSAGIVELRRLTARLLCVPG